MGLNSYARSYDSYATTSNDLASGGVWIIISLILAIVGGLVIYFAFLSKKNEGRFQGFTAWMYDFLSFKKMIIENILKAVYLMVALFITLASFAFISQSFLSFLVFLIVGNLITRVIYELALVTLIICKNTTEINKKMSSETKNKEEQ